MEDELISKQTRNEPPNREPGPKLHKQVEPRGSTHKPRTKFRDLKHQLAERMKQGGHTEFVSGTTPLAHGSSHHRHTQSPRLQGAG